MGGVGFVVVGRVPDRDWKSCKSRGLGTHLFMEERLPDLLPSFRWSG